MQVGIVRRMYRTFAARTAGRLDSKQSVRTLTSASHMSVFTLKNRRMIQRLSVYSLNQKIFTFKELESENIELKNYSDSLIDYQNSWWIIQRHNMLFLSLWSQPEHKMFVGCRQWRSGSEPRVSVQIQIIWRNKHPESHQILFWSRDVYRQDHSSEVTF